MSMRAYFAARAPKEVPTYFRPDPDKLVDVPDEDLSLKFCDGCKVGGDCEGDGKCDRVKIFARRDEISIARGENQKRIAAQWAWAWADAMIAMQ